MENNIINLNPSNVIDIAPESKLAVEPKDLATVVWYDEAGTVLATTQCPRSLPSILRHIVVKADDKAVKIKVMLSVKNEKGEIRELIISEGLFSEVTAGIADRIAKLGNAVTQLYMMISKLMDMSDLKGALLTCILDGRIEGFGILSESTEVTEEDVKMLGEGSENQAKAFKDNMRRMLNITFPNDDTSNIIVPPGTVTLR